MAFFRYGGIIIQLSTIYPEDNEWVIDFDILVTNMSYFYGV